MMSSARWQWLAIAAWCVGATADAQVEPSVSKWEAPGTLITLDFGPESSQRRVRFLDDGLAWEVSLDFLMVKHKRINLVADLPEAGEFKVVQSNPQALVDVKNVRVEGSQGRAELVARFDSMSPSDVATQARKTVGAFWDPVEKKAQAEASNTGMAEMYRHLEEELGRDALNELLVFRTLKVPKERKQEAREKIVLEKYVFYQTLKQVVPDFRSGLNELAKRKPGWVTENEQFRWKTSKGPELRDTYLELLECEIMDAHLKRCGMGFDTGSTNFKNKIQGWFEAVYVATSGKVGEDPTAARRVFKAMTPRDIQRLRELLSVRLRCRLYPQVDPRDPNAQWFNAQRIACRARGVSVIRVEGKLDPARNDRVDWWIVEDFSPTTVSFHVDKKAGFRVDPPFLYRAVPGSG